MEEMEILETLQSHYTIRTYELLHDQNNYYIITELAKVDFLNFLNERLALDFRPLNEHQVKFVAKQLLTAVQYLHKN